MPTSQKYLQQYSQIDPYIFQQSYPHGIPVTDINLGKKCEISLSSYRVGLTDTLPVFCVSIQWKKHLSTNGGNM